MKTIVIYYSKSGNNEFLANKVSKELDCDIEKIIPRCKLIPFQVLSTFTRISPGIKRIKSYLGDYDRVILLAPSWIGKVVYPLFSFIKKYRKQIKEIHYLSCCGCPDEEKDEVFGYENIFSQLRDLLGERVKTTIAIPIQLVLPEDKRKDDDALMAARLTSETFNIEVQEKYNFFINRL